MLRAGPLWDGKGVGWAGIGFSIASAGLAFPLMHGPHLSCSALLHMAQGAVSNAGGAGPWGERDRLSGKTGHISWKYCKCGLTMSEIKKIQNEILLTHSESECIVCHVRSSEQMQSKVN